MLAMTHALAGATIGATLGHPALVIPAAAASHLLLDALPHWNFALVRRITAKEILRLSPELLGMLAVSGGYLFWFPNRWLSILLGVFFAIAPDLLTEIERIFGYDLSKRFSALHERIQWELPVLPGLATQLLMVGLLLYLTIRFA